MGDLSPCVLCVFGEFHKWGSQDFVILKIKFYDSFLCFSNVTSQKSPDLNGGKWPMERVCHNLWTTAHKQHCDRQLCTCILILLL